MCTTRARPLAQPYAVAVRARRPTCAHMERIAWSLRQMYYVTGVEKMPYEQVRMRITMSASEDLQL
jgi:hypothetical protein